MKNLIVTILLFLGVCGSIFSQVHHPIPMPKGYERLDQFPIDTTSVFTNKEEAVVYASDENNTGYIGQVIAVTDTNSPGIYYIDNNRNLSAIGGSLTIIGKPDASSSITDYEGTTKIRFNHESGMYVKYISPNEVLIDLGSAWYTLYLDDGVAEGYTPKGEQPLNIRMNHNTNINYITMDTNTTPYWTLLIPSIGTPGIDGTGDLMFARIWNSTKLYSSNNIVIWNNSTYISKDIENNIGIEPGVNSIWENYWYAAATKGDKGDTGYSGATFIPMGEWTNNILYGSNQLVRYNNKQYYSLIDDNAEIPINSENWKIFLQDGERGIQGVPGTSAVVNVIGTITGEPGMDAAVVDESSIPHIANLKFTIPRGLPGLGLIPYGIWDENYLYPSNSLVRRTTNLYYNVTNSIGNDPLIYGEVWKLILSDGHAGPIGPQGPQGIQGEQGEIGPQGGALLPYGIWTNTISYPTNAIVRWLTNLYWNSSGDESLGDVPSETSLIWSVWLKDGDKGDMGPMGEIGPRGEKGDVGDIGPMGPQGERGNIGPVGPAGTSATINVHSTITLPADEDALVINEGTESAANFKFLIPRGPAGAALVPRGMWMNNINYPTNSLVRYETKVYYNIVMSSNCVPTNCTDWVVFLEDGGSVAGDATLLSIWKEPPEIDTSYPGKLYLDTNTINITNINMLPHLTIVGGGSAVGATPWEIDFWGNLVPSTNNIPSLEWEYDEYGDLMPKVTIQ